ncbi:shikimate dehydrogenase [Eikenella sp. S3360]|uniref:Shikimate dehydrogenase (NADP(+)) n=1 Tax=Eikenella glucosivorans TaxID=2766967 RepID=A0ABS0NDB9_9NEIS|nr:shikimate dehydrogenase [Eikenella glucosivorans]MBH5330314.1 shikimate dehydrogenase [Eikenella glucosivorans]
MPAPRYAVFGNPVAHSRSPGIHQMFAAQEGTAIEYERILAEPGRFAESAAAFFAAGGLGANVTVPFKTDACAWADSLSARARAAGAANTLIKQPNGQIHADNTDGLGLVADIRRHFQVALAGKRILLIGAGGAARGVILPLLECRPASLTIANRTAAKARELAEAFGASAAEFAELPAAGFDIAVNATSGSLSGQVPAIAAKVFAQCELAYDMAYGREPTAFMRFAQNAGAQRTADGLGMLVEQAAESYRLWRGFSPDTAPVLSALRAGVI